MQRKIGGNGSNRSNTLKSWIKYYYHIITTFLDQVLDMEFLKGKNGYYMHQNFYPFSEEMKEAFYAAE